jgi:hypothetical protein
VTPFSNSSAPQRNATRHQTPAVSEARRKIVSIYGRQRLRGTADVLSVFNSQRGQQQSKGSVSQRGQSTNLDSIVVTLQSGRCRGSSGRGNSPSSERSLCLTLLAYKTRCTAVLCAALARKSKKRFISFWIGQHSALENSYCSENQLF